MKAAIFETIALMLRSSHSHIVNTDQWHSINLARCSASRALLRPILPNQYAAFVEGKRLPRAQACPCQKQPLTNMTFRRRIKTMSGFPGSSLRWRRYPVNPRLRRTLRTVISGDVSVDRTALIVRVRSSSNDSLAAHLGAVRLVLCLAIALHRHFPELCSERTMSFLII
jgi:hypothetical protein